MPIYLKTSAATNSWRKTASLYLKTSVATNSWRKVVSAYIKTNDGWRSLFSSIVFPSIENQVSISSSGGINAGSTIMSDSSSITLTATRYHWNDADGFTYIWQKSSNNLTWSDIGSAQATTNPAAGSSSSSITKVLSSSDFTSGSDMYFRFKFIATNSTYSTSSSSESSSLLISYYGTPTPAPGSPSITGSTTVGNIAYGNIGTWTNSPTSYDYRWFFNAGLSSYPLTFSQARSVSNKYLSGFSAALVTSANHGYKANDTVLVSGMDSLFNGSHTITLKTNNTIYFTLPTPTAWSNAGTGYSSGTFVSYLGNAYLSISSISSVSPYNGGTSYSSGAIVYSGNNRYQSNLNNNIGNSVTNPIYWNPLGNFAPGGSQWTLQSFSNTVASGTTVAPNYYEGTVASSTSIALTTPTTDYKTSIDLRGNVLGFGVKAYNQATLSPSEYTANAFVYGIPVITIGTIVLGSTSASIPFTQAYMTSYDIDIKYLGSSVSGYPATVSSPSSPISVTGLTSERTYAYTISPKNGEGTFGTSATGSFTTAPPPPATPTITYTNVTFSSFTVSWSSAGSTSYNVDVFESVSGASVFSASGTTATTVSPTGLQPNRSYSTTVTAINAGGTATNTVSQTTSLGPALTPTFGANSSTTGGFFGSVTNYDANYTFEISTSAGSVSFSSPSGSTRAFTVSGLSNGQSATVTVTTSRTNYNSGSAQTTGSASVVQYTVTWNANGGSGGGTTTQNAGVAHTAPSPGTRSGYTFNGYYNTPSGDYIYGPIASGGSFTPPSNITMYARWSVTPIIPTITMGANSGVTETTGTINWTSTNQASFSATGTFSGSGTTATSISKTGLSAGTNYSGTVTVTSSTGHTASANYSLTTSVAQYTVTWNANGGTGGGSTTQNAGVAHTAPSPGTRSGFTFSGYYNTPSADFLYGPIASGGSFTPPSSITMYARWAAIVPNVTQITALGLGNTSAPYIRFTITSTNAASLSIMLYRSATSSTGPWTPLGSPSIQSTSGTLVADFSSRTGTTSNWYYVDVTPYFGASATGTSGTTRTSRVKRGTETSTTTVYP
jgi:hypothetical protein